MLVAALFVVVIASACGSDSGTDASQPSEATLVGKTDEDVATEEPTTTTTSAPTTTTTTTTTTTEPPEPETQGGVDVAESVAAESSEPDDATKVTDEANLPEPGSPEEAAMEAWMVVFDSAADFEDKAMHLETGENLRTSNERYAGSGQSVGGITMSPKSAVIEGNVASITYDVEFSGNAAYRDLVGTIELVDGTWVVSRDEYCGILTSARSACLDK